MKKEYIQPTLTTYGNVEQLTQANGNGSAADSINFAAGTPFGGATGSTQAGILFGLAGSADITVLDVQVR